VGMMVSITFSHRPRLGKTYMIAKRKARRHIYRLYTRAYQRYGREKEFVMKRFGKIVSPMSFGLALSKRALYRNIASNKKVYNLLAEFFRKTPPVKVYGRLYYVVPKTWKNDVTLLTVREAFLFVPVCVAVSFLEDCEYDDAAKFIRSRYRTSRKPVKRRRKNGVYDLQR